MLSGYEYPEVEGQLEVRFFFLVVDLHQVHRRDVEMIDAPWVFLGDDLAVVTDQMAGQYLKPIIEKLDTLGVPEGAYFVGVHDGIQQPGWRAERQPLPWLNLVDDEGRLSVQYVDQHEPA